MPTAYACRITGASLWIFKLHHYPKWQTSPCSPAADQDCWARRALCEAAWAAARTKSTYLSAQFRRLAALRGTKRAIVAVASTLLTIGYHLLHAERLTTNSVAITSTGGM